MAGMVDGMVEWQTEMATYVLFMLHTDNTDDDRMAKWRPNGGMVEWR